MIMMKKDNTYKQVGFKKVRQADGSYKDVEYQYSKDSNGDYKLTFEKGFTREIEGALPLTLSSIGKPLKDYTIEGNAYQSDGVSPDTPQEVVGCGGRTGNLWDEEWEVGNVNSETGGNLNIASGIRAINYMPITPNTEYVMSVTGNSYTVGIQGRFYDKDKNYIGYSPSNASGVLPNVPFTTPDNAYYFRFSMQAVYGTEYKNDITLNSGSTPLPYEPYGYKLDVASRGKNLWKTFSSKVSSGVTIVHNGEKYLFSGTCNESINISLGVELDAGTYSLQANANRIPVENINSCIDVWIPSLSKLYNIKNEVATYNTISFSIDTPTECSLRIRLENGVDYTGFTLKPQLELGEKTTEYSPYVEPITTPIYLDSPLYKIGDYSDSIGSKEEVRVIKELVLTGEEDWALPTANTFRLTVNGYLRELKLICICTHYKAVENIEYLGSSFSDKSVTFLVSTSGNNYCYIRDSSIPDTTAWKAYLKEQYNNGTPVKVYYVLAEPESKVVNPVEIPTLDGTTIIETETVVEPSNVYLKYKSSK